MRKRTDARARSTDPHTSHDAAVAVSFTALEWSTLQVLIRAGDYGATASEIAQLLVEPRDSISPRMVNLELKGLIVRTTERRASLGHRAQIVWKAIKKPDLDQVPLPL